MKWFLVIALSLLLVVVCVVYFRHEMRPFPVPPARIEVVKKPAAKPGKTARVHAPKPGPKSPVDISGPLKDRDLISWVLPEYPEWAKEQGITGTLRMKIWVTPAGLVKSFMQPQQLSADPRLDEKAVEALHEWQFAEKPNSFGDQWGVITIRFSLLAKEAGAPEASLRGVSLGGSTASGAWRCVKQWVGKEFRYYCRLVRPQAN
jgi:TonB family protein